MHDPYHLHLGHFLLVFDAEGVTITHASRRTFRITDTRAANGPHLLQHYGLLFRAMRDEEDMRVVPELLGKWEVKEPAQE